MAPAAAAMRKTVTVLFCDLVESTELGERLDPERLRSLLARWYEAMREPIERHGGTVEKFIGDAVMAVFGVPQVHEDDALRAVRAAVEMRAAVEALNEELAGPRQPQLAIRIGVNTGEVVAGADAATLVSGDAVNTAKRLEEAATSGAILVGPATRRLVENAVELEPADAVAAKGKRLPIEAWRVLGTIPGASAFARRLDAPLVGRTAELELLRAELEVATRERSCRFVTLLGPAGIGKSRLAAALAAEAPSALTTRCLPYGDSYSVLPIAGLVSAAGGDATLARIAGSEPDGELIAARLREASISPEERQWGVRRLLETLARERPLVVCVEDVHWAQAPFLDLLEYVAGWTENAPLLVLCLSRPELVDERPRWPGRTVPLAPLAKAEASRLLDELASEWPLGADARRQVLEVAEGNPLFVEQMVAMLADHGALHDIPPSIHALLAARLDGLAPLERAVIERASVIGRDFSRGAVTELSPEDERSGVGATLLALTRKDFLAPQQSRGDGDDGFRFRHALIRDATYAATSKSVRAELHSAVAERLARLDARDEAVGYHLEQATHLRSDLGQRDDETARRAGELLAKAGLHAGSHSDAAAATGLLRRSLALLPPTHRQRPEVVFALSGALWVSGDADAAELALAEAIDTARAAGDLRVEWYARLERAGRSTMSSGDTAGLVRVAEHAIEVFEELGDELGVARAWRRIAMAASAERGWGTAVEAWERACAHASASGDDFEAARAADALCSTLVFGPIPVGEALLRIERLLEGAEGNVLLRANAITALAAMRAMLGEFDAARSLLAEAHEVYEPLGLALAIAGWGEIVAIVERLAGDDDAAVIALRRSYELVDLGGHVGYRTMLAARLAFVLATLGDSAGARSFLRLCEESPSTLDVQTTAEVRGARALLDNDVRLAREAAELADSTDDVNLRASMQLTLARVTGDPSPLEIARALYTEKGNVAAESLVRAVEADIVASI
jgi:class 3 adenylate cyclase/tetratricopeptide (TPR) repeat protein